MVAIPLPTNDVRMTSAVRLPASRSLMLVAQPISPAAARRAINPIRYFLFIAILRLAFHRRRIVDAAFGIPGKIHDQRGDGFRRVLRRWKALLPETIPQTMLHGSQLALRYAIPWPGSIGVLCIGLVQQVRQILQTDAPLRRRVTGRARKIVSTGAIKK